MNIICVNTGTKYDQWYTDNLKYMIDKHSNLKYDSFNVIDDEVYGGVYDKLQMFDKFKKGQNLYFDLDVIIKSDCNHFIKKDFTVLHAWWRSEGDFYKTNPINSSIISWYGDVSYIHKKFADNPDKYMLIYDRGIDEYLYANFNLYTFNDNLYCSYQTIKDETEHSVCLFNQKYEYMKTTNWCQKFLLQSE